MSQYRLWRNSGKRLPEAICLSMLTIAALLSGCAWFPEQTKRADMNNLPEIKQTLSSAREFLPAGNQWPAQTWWTTFGSPTLNRLIETAIADNPDFKATSARLRQTQALVDARAAELYPTVEANVSFSAERYSANSTQVKFAGEHFRQLLFNPLRLRYHLDLWGGDKAGLEAAIGKAMAHQAELMDAKLVLAATVARSYFDLVSATEKLKIAEQLVAYRQRLLKIAQVRLKTGLVSAGPPLNAQIEHNTALQRQAIMKAEVALQKDLLATLAGKGPDWGLSIKVDQGISLKQLTLPDDLPLRLLAHRPDITAARLRAEAAAQDIKVAKTAFYPDVNLIGFAGLHTVSITDILSQGSSLAYAVGPSINFPIFEGGRLRAQLTYQEAAFDAAVESYNNSLLNAVREVADALTQWRQIDTRLTSQQHSVSDVTKTSRLALSLNNPGLSDRGELMQAQAVEDEQRFRLATLQGEHFKAAINVIMALGEVMPMSILINIPHDEKNSSKRDYPTTQPSAKTGHIVAIIDRFGLFHLLVAYQLWLGFNR
ncbi:MAG: efflux transporter outer membrane subunit [Methylobacter sp.]